MSIDVENRWVTYFLSWIQHYNHHKYWKMRKEVVDPNSKKSKLVRLYYLYRIKRSDAFNNASMGTNFGAGALFASPPNLPHHLNGIIVSPFTKIGKDVTLSQQVTIAIGKDQEGAVIGDHVCIGAGAKIIGHVKIGDYAQIGANAVVVHDVPAYATAVGVPAKIILHKST